MRQSTRKEYLFKTICRAHCCKHYAHASHFTWETLYTCNRASKRLLYVGNLGVKMQLNCDRGTVSRSSKLHSCPIMTTIVKGFCFTLMIGGIYCAVGSNRLWVICKADYLRNSHLLNKIDQIWQS